MSDRPLKVLTLATDYLPNIGGISNHIHYLNRNLVSLGIAPEVLHVVERSDREHWEQTDDGYPVVPYKFCSDEYAGGTPTCDYFDMGPDPYEIMR